MLLSRAMVLQLSGRAMLAIAAVAISVAYGVLALAAAGLLASSPIAFDAADGQRPTLLIDPDGIIDDDAALPDDAIRLHRVLHEGKPLATLVPWPYDEQHFDGPYAPGSPPSAPNNTTWQWRTDTRAFVPADAYTLEPEALRTLVGGLGPAVAVYVPRADVQVEGLASLPGVSGAAFYEQGAADLQRDLYALVAMTGVVGGMLVAGFVRLEILARRGEYETIQALAGAHKATSLILGRAAFLSGAGVALGIVAALGIARVLETARPEAALSIPLAGVLTAIAVTMGTGMLLGGWAARHAVGETRGRTAGSNVNRFPGPVQFLLVTPRILPGVFAATFVAILVLTAFAGALAVPDELFGTQDEDEAVLVEGSSNPLRGSADRFLGIHGAALDAVHATLPLTFAPTVLTTGPIMVKGTDHTLWRNWTGAQLLAGTWPTTTHEATIGERAARQHDIALGERVLLPATYRADHAWVTISGIHHAGGLDDDELLTSLDVAGRLAELPPDRVTMVHLRLADPAIDARSLSISEGIQVLDVRIDPVRPAPHTLAQVEMDLANFGPGAATRDLTVWINGDVAAALAASLDGKERRTVSAQVLVPAAGNLTIQVNPTTVSQTGDPALVLAAPLRVRPQQDFDVTIEDRNGTAARSLLFVDDAVLSASDDDGHATVQIQRPGIYALSARRGNDVGGTQIFVSPSSWDEHGGATVRSATVGARASHNDTHYRIDINARIENPSPVPFSGSINITVGDQPVGTLTADVSPEQAIIATASHHVSYQVTTIRIDQAHLILPEDPPPPPSEGSGDDAPSSSTPAEPQRPPPSTFEGVLDQVRQTRSPSAGPAADPARAFLDDVFARLDIAGSLIILMTFVHTGSLAWVSVHREVRERDAVARSLAAVGMDEAHRRHRMLRDGFISAAVAVASGLLGAAVAAAIALHLGFPSAFGHVIPLFDSWDVPLRAATIVGIVVLAAAIHANQKTRTSSGPSVPRRPPDAFWNKEGQA